MFTQTYKTFKSLFEALQQFQNYIQDEIPIVFKVFEENSYVEQQQKYIVEKIFANSLLRSGDNQFTNFFLKNKILLKKATYEFNK